jgi:antitoxin component YwqK of YwqJK toxin-antitoxin module
MNTLDLINLTPEEKIKGVWFSGIKGEGEYKQWYNNGQLVIHCFYKNNELEGEYKIWYENGQLFKHCFYRDSKLEGEYKEWDNNGKLIEHSYYENGVKI